MRILLTGATGYIGRRLLPALLDAGHEVVVCVRDRSRFPDSGNLKIEVIEVDFLLQSSLSVIPKDIDAAYYLIHSMGASTEDFEKLEAETARNFVDAINETQARQIIYLGGIVNADELSKHLRSRLTVERILNEGQVPVTAFRAGIIVGSGSASFEIIRDLVEKLPVMVTPRWVRTRSKPIAVRNVIEFLIKCLDRPELLGRSVDIGGPEVLTYKEMLLQYAEVRGLKRFIWTLPFLTPRLSSYWLYFVTATNYKLAVNLVDSMKVEVIPEENDIAQALGIELMPYQEAVNSAFQQIRTDTVVSSWKDAFASSDSRLPIMQHIEVPSHGCFKDRRSITHSGNPEILLDRIWAIGGETGWYYANTLWSVRGFLDKIVGGVGLRRGRTRRDDIHPGDALDFWRVLLADRRLGRLLLFAEMKLPGEAWLEFKLNRTCDHHELVQEATFRPKGLWGRIYWYLMSPFHHIIFGGMIRNIQKKAYQIENLNSYA